MNKFLMTADVHFHNYPQFSTPEARFGSNRVASIAESLLAMRDHATADKNLVIIGDLFHTRGMLSVSLMNTVRGVIAELSQVFNITIIAGNHDQANKSGTQTSVAYLAPWATIVENFTVRGNCAFLPFRESRLDMVDMFNKAAEAKVEYVFAHVGVLGATIGTTEYQPSEDLALSDLGSERFRYVFLGHYHKHQWLNKNTMYLGNPCQTSFSDAGLVKGFWEFDDTKDTELVLHETGQPEFHQLTITDKASLLKFIKTYKPVNYYKLRMADNLGLPNDTPNVIIERATAKEEYQPRIKGMDTMTESDTLEAYAKYRGFSIDSEVIEMGKDLIKRAKEARNAIS